MILIDIHHIDIEHFIMNDKGGKLKLNCDKMTIYYYPMIEMSNRLERALCEQQEQSYPVPLHKMGMRLTNPCLQLEGQELIQGKVE